MITYNIIIYINFFFNLHILNYISYTINKLNFYTYIFIFLDDITSTLSLPLSNKVFYFYFITLV